MISYAEALALLLAEAPSPGVPEEVPLEGAPGRFVARDLRAPGALPTFANSAMDGFALTAGGRELPAGTRLRVAGSLAAGDRPVEAGGGAAAAGAGPEVGAVEPGAGPVAGGGAAAARDRPAAHRGEALPPAWEIMTGAPVPRGLDTVVPVERVEVEEEDEGGRPLRIRLAAPAEPGRHIRPAGTDFAAGDRVLSAGRRIGPAELMALAGLGIARVPVLPGLRAAVLCTGPELVDDLGRELRPGEIRNSNGPFLRAALHGQGVRVVASRTLGDEAGPFVEAVGGALEAGAGLVVSTGAVSMGRHDFVPEALRRLGARTLFHRVAIRPGKPVLAARLPGGALFLGLPGNPISAAVGHRFFVVPVLRRLRGQAPERTARLPLAEEARKRPELRYFVRVALAADGRGEAAGGGAGTAVRIIPGQQSYRIRPLVDADGWAVLPEGSETLAAGTRVEVCGLYGTELNQ